MKNSLVLIFALILLTNLGIAQNSPSLVKNKLALEYDLNFSPDILGFGKYEWLSGMEKISSTKVFHSLVANYKLKSKIALTVNGGFHSSNMSLRYGRVIDDKVPSTAVKMKGTEIGVGLKFYFRNHRAPLGNSFDVFLKNQSVKLEGSQLKDYNGDDYKLNSVLLGVALNYITMITPKSSVYFKYGVSAAFPVVVNETIPVYQPNASQEDDINIDTGSFTETSISEDYKSLNYIKFHVGLGYAF